MRRIEMTEIHDHPRFPTKLRNLTTEALEALWEFGNSYWPVVAMLHESLTRSEEGPARVVDLCSGGGGPWMAIARRLKKDYGLAAEVCLSDRYPNAEAFEWVRERALASGIQIRSSALPVDATRVPSALKGFRTIFSSFHHFGPEEARAVLSSAVASGEGIGIFEVAGRGVLTMLAVSVTPLLVLWLTPRIRPFRWSRLLWTYVLPVVPFVIGYDGLVSCLRTYSQAELHGLVEGMDGYRWRIGETRSGFLPVTYLVGQPTEESQ